MDKKDEVFFSLEKMYVIKNFNLCLIDKIFIYKFLVEESKRVWKKGCVLVIVNVLYLVCMIFG